MRLGLSSAADPLAPLDELLAACVRRGLDVLELRDGDGHGVSERPDGVGGAEARRLALEAGVTLSGLLSESDGSDLRLARLAVAAEVPVLVGRGHAMEFRIERARQLAEVGADVAVVLEHHAPQEHIEAALGQGLALAWELHAEAPGAGPAAERILSKADHLLRHVRVLGGGPEAALRDGEEMGEAMRLLALAGYQGALVLAPGSAGARTMWRHWLRRRGGWGCGSAADGSLVRLQRAAAAAEREP